VGGCEDGFGHEQLRSDGGFDNRGIIAQPRRLKRAMAAPCIPCPPDAHYRAAQPRVTICRSLNRYQLSDIYMTALDAEIDLF
jgi:hypothetical protein